MMIFDIRIDDRAERVAAAKALLIASPMKLKEAIAIIDAGRVVVTDSIGQAWVQEPNPYFQFVASLSHVHMVPELLNSLSAGDTYGNLQPSPTLPDDTKTTIAKLSGGLGVLADRLGDQGNIAELALILLDKVNTLIDEYNIRPIHPRSTWTFEE